MSTTEKTYEMLWDCEFCHEKKLLGLSQRFCPTCGAPQNPARRYFPEDADKVAVEDHPYVGADVTCPACRQPMSRRCNNCSNCGSPLEAGRQVATRAEEMQGQGGAWQAPGAAPPGAPGAAASPPAKSRAGIILLVIVLVLVALGVARAMLKKDAEVKVVRHEWTREIAIERFDEVEDKGPCKSAPADARIVSRGKAEPTCTTKRIDNGDGTFKEKKECTEAVEQCTYKVDKWKAYKTATEKGDLAREPVWPTLSLKLGACRGCERPGEKTEKYTVYFSGAGGKEFSCSSKDAAAWRGHAQGAKYKAKVNVIGGDLDCASLKR